jgi:surfeit locus 1 family protein
VSPPGATRKQQAWIGPLICALLVFTVLVALGTWQIKRKAWKEGLIAALTEQLAAPPGALPASSAWSNLDRAADEYGRIRFTAAFENAKEALVYGAPSAFRPDVSGPGYWVFTPARLADGSFVIVNRGFVPEARKDKAARTEGELASPVEIVGVMRWPEARHWYSPTDDPAHNLWFTRDPAAIADAKDVHPVAPFYVEQESPIPLGGWPRPGKIVVDLPNNHLQYALTWYGLAAVLMVMFIVWARKSGREAGNASASRQGASRSL